MDSIQISRTFSRIRDRYIQFMICDQDKKADLLNKLVINTIYVNSFSEAFLQYYLRNGSPSSTNGSKKIEMSFLISTGASP